MKKNIPGGPDPVNDYLRSGAGSIAKLLLALKPLQVSVNDYAAAVYDVIFHSGHDGLSLGEFLFSRDHVEFFSQDPATWSEFLKTARFYIFISGTAAWLNFCRDRSEF